MTAPTTDTPTTGASVGKWQEHNCPICGRVMHAPRVLPGQPPSTWKPLTFIEGLGFAHCDCAAAWNEGRLQSRMSFGEAA